MSPLNLYARLMCRAIWTARRVFPAREDGSLPDIPVEKRDWEWTSDRWCEVCLTEGSHIFVEWLPEKTVTAKCQGCLFEGTL